MKRPDDPPDGPNTPPTWQNVVTLVLTFTAGLLVAGLVALLLVALFL
ncbi:hypothetical protein DAETH_38980 (plasmid) [Deinococcus aetherius]|uniref:Uncharacterized protein n=1 Tax=Deinococcus aetherius TaxID=200252 RepID=A0ABM8AJF2_9DEIO|nr:hypothetical protein [Deinococcus aetherius]BDP43929.1 hypothetical protein DAETH_38980 [Deinococcus aetherius]